MPVLPPPRVTEPPPQAWVAVLTFLVPTVLLWILGWQTWQPFPVGVWHDDGAYVLIAESLANGGGLSWFGVSGTPPAAKFPPLYPAVLSLLLRAGVEPQSGATAFAALNFGFIAVAGGLFALFLRRAFALHGLWAAAVAILLWLSPRIWAVGALPLSEPLFLVGLTTALLASTRVEPGVGVGSDLGTRGQPASSRAGFPPGLDFMGSVALVFYTRTVGIAVALGLIAACVWRRAHRTAILLTVGTAVVVLPWMVWSGTATRRIPEPLRDVLGGYGGWLLREMARDPLTFIGSALVNAWASWGTLAAMAVPGLPGQPHLRTGVAIALGIIAAYGIGRLGRYSLTAAATLLIYLAIVAIWPFRAPRLVVPVFPLVGLAVVLAIRGAVAATGRDAEGSSLRPTQALWVRRAVLAASAVLTLNYAVRSGVDLIEGNHLVPYQLRAEALATAVQAVGEFTNPQDVVGAPELWAGLQIHANRIVAPSARFLPLAMDGPSWGTPTQQHEAWAAAQLDYLVVEHAGGVHGAALDALDEACPDGAVQLVATLPTGFLVRLAWDDECRSTVIP